MTKKDSLINYIKTQVSVDITSHIDLNHSTRRYLALNTDKLSRIELNRILSLTIYKDKKFRIENNGGLGIALIYTKEN